MMWKKLSSITYKTNIFVLIIETKTTVKITTSFVKTGKTTVVEMKI